MMKSQIRIRSMQSAILSLLSVLLVPAVSGAGPYRDKHGNPGALTLGSAVVNAGGAGIDYSVPYSLMDSVGNTSGEYVITSEMLPGKDPGSDDFVLNVFVIDDPTQNAAKLVFRNNPNVAPLAPVLQLLDCSTDPCTENATYGDPKWGPWVIQDQSHIANYPIELLDARVLSQLLEPAQLSQLPNNSDATGNWDEIMENHRTNFEEARFRIDVDHLGEPQSDLLTSRMIAEIVADLGTPDDWLVRHFPGIQHSALTFLTGHRALIEDMTTELFNNWVWPLDFSFPFGRMPAWLVDPHLDADPVGFHVLPTHWERVIPGQGPLSNPGCWHDYPVDGEAPSLANGATNLGQYECTQIATPNGFVDRPCTQEPDYSGPGTLGSSLLSDVESAYHNPIHGFIGGSFGPPGTTAGTMVFWTFHTYVSTVVLSNWRTAQKRDMPVPVSNQPPVADAGADQTLECAAGSAVAVLDGTGSSDPDFDPLTFSWSAPGIVFDDPTSPVPTATFPLGNTIVTLTVDDGNGAQDSDEVTVTVEDTTPPMIDVALSRDRLWPPNHKMANIAATVVVTDSCDPNPTFTLTSASSSEPDNGNGDGNTTNDIQGVALGTPDVGFQLRSERAGNGGGRVYTVVYQAEDASMQTSTDDATVRVSKK